MSSKYKNPSSTKYKNPSFTKNIKILHLQYNDYGLITLIGR
jgi:hypothetical protein